MQSKWSSHLHDQKEKENFQSLVKNSSIVLSRLHEIIQERMTEIQKARVSEDGFKDPNWAYLQAHQLGRIKELLDIQKLLK